MSNYDGTKTQAIIEMARANPHLRNKEICEALGVTPPLVSKVRMDHGVTRPPKPQSIFVAVDFVDQPEVHAWLTKTCPPGVNLGAYIVSIVTDAMLEERDG